MKKFFYAVLLVSAMASTQAEAQTTSDSAATAPSTTVTTTPDSTTTTTVVPSSDGTASTTVTTTNKTEGNMANDALENTLYLDLKDGRVVIQLMPQVAPNTVKRIKELVRQGFYDGVPFHRVIPGFMAQTGDPTGTGTGGSGQKLDAEFNSEKHVRGTVSMARASDPNSADSQFFIVFDDAPHLDNNYTVFGKVTEGMEFVDKIKKGSGMNGMVTDPDKIIKLRVAADVKDEATTGGAASSPAQ